MCDQKPERMWADEENDAVVSDMTIGGGAEAVGQITWEACAGWRVSR